MIALLLSGDFSHPQKYIYLYLFLSPPSKYCLVLPHVPATHRPFLQWRFSIPWTSISLSLYLSLYPQNHTLPCFMIIISPKSHHFFPAGCSYPHQHTRWPLCWLTLWPILQIFLQFLLLIFLWPLHWITLQLLLWPLLQNIVPTSPSTFTPTSSPTLSPKSPMTIDPSYYPIFSLALTSSSLTLAPTCYPNIALDSSPTWSLDVYQMPSLLLSLLGNPNFT